MIAALQRRWQHLADRERAMLALGGGACLLILAYAYLIDPQLEDLDRLARQASRRERAMSELTALARDYETVVARIGQLEAKARPATGAFPLLPFLEETASQGGIRERIASMQPVTAPAQEGGFRESSVELRLDGVTMPQLLGFLAQLDRAPVGLQIKRFQLKPRFDAPYLLEARLRVSSYEKE
jgi:type II secretory pathway component PulM